jgi:putative transposase
MEMRRKRKHFPTEISVLLAQADDLARQGRLQSDIAQTLGVSVMTLHRWRKKAQPETGQFEQENHLSQRVAELQDENSRLRRAVTDLMLEKIELEEAARQKSRPRAVR